MSPLHSKHVWSPEKNVHCHLQLNNDSCYERQEFDASRTSLVNVTASRRSYPCESVFHPWLTLCDPIVSPLMVTSQLIGTPNTLLATDETRIQGEF